ncbi:MAG: sterol desaturase family protein [Burkholderiales bacterium]|jgi:sterol desaturase/sphingolipid hydroxylase (fatty acid hydroxylase superfamily)
MIDWIESIFAELQQHVFETGVLPVLHGLGLGGYAERAFDATEFFLIGAIEITLLALLLGALEKWRPAEAQTHVEWKKTDAVYTMLHRLGFVPLLLFFMLLPLVDTLNGALRMHDIIPPNLEDLMPWLNAHPLLSFLFYLVLLDFVAYWLHRWQHRFNWWWSLHALHHSQREMSFWTDDRNHLLDDLIVDGVYALIAILIGVPPAQFLAIIVASRMVESLSHANVRLSFGRIGEYLLVSPRFHRVHHAIGLGHEGAARGHNFAVLFPIWDVLFGTANMEPVFPATGIRDQLQGRDYGDTFWRQQWLGLKRLFGGT